MLVKINKLKLSLIFFVFYLSGCADIKTLNNLRATNEIKVSNPQIKRLYNYMEGEFYSYEIGRNVTTTPLAFLISMDGQKSLILACDGYKSDCNLNVQIYQQIKKYKKQKNIDLKILALGKKIKINNMEISKILKSTKAYKLNKNEDIFFDKIFVPVDSCSDIDC